MEQFNTNDDNSKEVKQDELLEQQIKAEEAETTVEVKEPEGEVKNEQSPEASEVKEEEEKGVPKAEGVKEEEQKVEEQKPEEEQETKEEPAEEPEPETPSDEELKREAEYDELKAKLAELEEEKEIRSKVVEFVDFKNNAELEFDNFCLGLQDAVNKEFEKYHLDTSKTLADLSEIERATATNIINQAMAMREQKARAIAQAVDAKYHSVVFAKAEKVFDKFDMSNEQAEVAAQTFVNIVRQAGIQDLSEDLVEKVKLSVAKALMDVPKKTEEAPETMQEAIEKAEEIVEEKTEEIKEAVDEVAENVKEEPAEPKADLSGYMDSIDGTTSGTGAEVLNEDNVLEKMAQLPHKDRMAFYKENYDLVERAARKESAKRAAKKGSI